MSIFSKVKGMLQSHLWWFEDVVLPFSVTRFALLFVGVVMAQIIPPSPFMPSQGWQFSPHRAIDIWGRWDSGWYMSIAQHGYSLVTNAEGQANYAFFPLYPCLIRTLHHILVPAAHQTRGTFLLVGIIVSNLSFLGALTVLHGLVRSLGYDRHLMQDTIWYLCVFPASFIFSSFYAESLFLLFSIIAFYAAEKRKWWLVGLTGGLAALSRAPGILSLIPLAILYWRKERTVKWDAVFLGLIAVGFFIISLMYITLRETR
ncbi:MAG: mannosyltransferase family protein [Anaerolineae bacterium]|jgi:Gpi18-like mannosyltransferase|nr:mannosyltransferase family protein [Anaerolineae bacterium]